MTTTESTAPVLASADEALTATVPAASNGVGGRVISGVARDDVNSRLTPVAIAMPSPLTIDFAVYWAARDLRTG
jgi:hypothetical protein